MRLVWYASVLHAADGRSEAVDANIFLAWIFLKKSVRSHRDRWTTSRALTTWIISHAVSQISRLGHADRLGVLKPYTLQTVHLRLQAVREDHFSKVSSGRPSDGSIVVSVTLTSMCDTIPAAVDRHHSLRSTEATRWHVSLGAHVSVLWSRSAMSRLLYHISCAGHVSHILHVSHAARQRPPGPRKDAWFHFNSR